MPRPTDETRRNACRNCVYWLPCGEDDQGEQTVRVDTIRR